MIICSTILCSHAVPQLTLPNITKYIPQILEIKAASLKGYLGMEDVPASSVEEVLSAWIAGKGVPSLQQVMSMTFPITFRPEASA